MSYQVGIDLGTTYTAAAVHRDGRASIFSLGNQSSSVPSVVLLRDDGTELTGDAAVRRALTEPERVAREFKRRLGDTTPIIVGGAPYSAEQLMARLITSTLGAVAQREGGPPDRIAVTHPANWGPYKIDLLRQAIRMAGLDPDAVDLLTEPEAAAIHYASNERVEPGEVVAVYDLGGGTFDAAVLRKTADGFEIIGRPEGIERMGGIDFDAAVFAHVDRALDGQLQELDPEDPLVVSGVARLREDCVDAKVALSSDTDATIPVLLPGIQTDVRITRSEFENAIRPSLADSIAAMDRALESAGVQPDEVSKVLLVGGSSRIPLISQMVSSELGRPVAVDADPKHSIALGAAVFAGQHRASDGAAAVGGAAAAGAAGAAAAAAAAAGAETAPTEPMPATPAAPPVPPPPPAPEPTQVMPAAPPVAPPPPPTGPTGPGPQESSDSTRRTALMVGGGILGVVVLAVIAFVLFGGGDDGDDVAETTILPDTTVAADTTVAPDTTVAADTTVAPESTAAPDTTTPPDATTPPVDDATIEALVQPIVAGVAPQASASVSGGVVTLAGEATEEQATDAINSVSAVPDVAGVDDQMVRRLADELCTESIMSLGRWACINSATFDGNEFRATFDFADGGEPFNQAGGFHLHFFSDSFTPERAGTDGAGESVGGGLWIVWDDTSGFTGTPGDFGGEEPTRLCVRIAQSDHSIASLTSGNCFPVERI